MQCDPHRQSADEVGLDLQPIVQTRVYDLFREVMPSQPDEQSVVPSLRARDVLIEGLERSGGETLGENAESLTTARFDHTGIALDLNVVYPIDRLEELAANGSIGAVAPRHISFAGNQPDDVATIRLDSGPRAAQLLKDDGVDVVLLTPV